jgi:hypothetical protein
MAARFAGMLRQEEHDAVAEKRPVLTAFAAFFGDFRTPSASETLHECRMAALERAGPETRWTERPPDARMGMKRTVWDLISRSKESLMRNSTRLGIALGVTLAALAGCKPANMPATQQTGRSVSGGQGDTDGLSRNPEDCDRGCLGGNAN